MDYFQTGEEVTVVNNANGFNGDWVVYGRVATRNYKDPVTGANVRLDFDPAVEPAYWLEGALQPLRDGQGDGLCLFPQHQLRKKYKKGTSFQELVKAHQYE